MSSHLKTASVCSKREAYGQESYCSRNAWILLKFRGFNVFILFFQGERESEPESELGMGEAEGEEERILSRLHTQHGARYDA